MGGGASREAFGQVFRNRDLRRLQLAEVGSTMGHWGYVVALLVWAYAEGGATLTGIAAFVRLAPGAVSAPFAGALADRAPRRRVMVVSDLLRAAALGLAALAMAADLAPVLILVPVGLAAVASSAFIPARSALLPSITRTPEELTAANVVASAVDGIGSFAGPALGGALLVVSSPQAVFGATCVCLLWSAALVVGIRGESRPETVEHAHLLRAVADGLRASVSGPRVRLILGLVAAQTFTAGLLTVLTVVIALDLLGRDEGWVGLLNGAVGVGGLLGVVASAWLSARRGLAWSMGFGTALFSAPLLLIAGFQTPAVALAALGIVGIANTIADVSTMTLLQRAVDDAVLARVFGALETIVLAAIALGGLMAPLAVNALGERGALVAAGLLLPLTVAATAGRLRALDHADGPPAEVLELLRGLPPFAPLPRPVLERLAFDAEAVTFPAGTIFAQGDEGDRFYVIAEGTVDVDVDGRTVRREGRGDGFGEIALLHETPRTATVTATGPVTLYALGRDAFVTAVTGHAASNAAAQHLAASRLLTARPSM
jgi:MFS family permease